MRTLKFLLQKEFLQIFRDKTMLRIILMMPLIQLLIFPWAATFEQRNISLSVIDNDKSTLSKQLIEKAISSGYFKLTDYSDSYEEAMISIEQNTADLILEIPRNFENDLIKEQSSGLMLSVNAINGQKASLGSNYISQIITDFNRDIISSTGQSSSLTNNIEVSTYFRYNPEMNYRIFMVPAILVLLITIIGGMLSALNIVREKEKGTMEQINVTPIGKATFILSKLIPFWIIGYVMLTIGLIASWLMYGLIPAGNILIIYFFSFFYLLAFSGIGLIISNYSETQQQAMLIAFFFMLIFVLLSGMLTPISSMPQWAQMLTLINPIRYFIEVIRLIFIKGSGLFDILPQLFATIGFAIVCNIWAILSYKKTN
ncbi:ABC transporter permease [Dysgonomonas macrotermitis]|uniref:ABC-2 type transport system permease protein n=1 Tax=Dysgonomonas macrotermitis TaxID=1346286 RepID=A0A1M4SUS5_9BACT|nr:ABC transporter permease [Dysgonomonas macrotermitis]SHE35961.1 ABC-2 type transport system permease protein [Dysgonomonas macrotermitis]